MCGIAGIVSLTNRPLNNLNQSLEVMSKLLIHRGPDGKGKWVSNDSKLGFIHQRLAIIDLTKTASQPMQSKHGSVVTFNGEIYNYKELWALSKYNWDFITKSDTETILASYHRYGFACMEKLRGMFSFALWDDREKNFLCARDRFGIKPFYYTIVDGVFYFASEIKALLPFLKMIETNGEAMAEYLTFQYTIGEKTLFDGIFQLLPGHALSIVDRQLNIWRYWDVSYEINFKEKPIFFQKRVEELLYESVELHCRSDVKVGSYISGGIDSSLIYLLAQKKNYASDLGFHGTFKDFPQYDESEFAKSVTDSVDGVLHTVNIDSNDFQNNIENVIYYLDFPVAGPGSFPQYMVSKLAKEHLKVVLGGQGGDEIFGGYARYVIAYLEQCLKAAIDGDYKSGNYVVTIESIIPNLGILREYKPLIQKFWSTGLFESMDRRYFRLVDRSTDMGDVINWTDLDMFKVFEDFSAIFNNPSNVKKEAYFDKMTHFDFKCLLPSLLQVEDRMSMAHGLESRVPLLDHPLVELCATIPADLKFKGGNMKHLLKKTFSNKLPSSIINRRDKMGFPVPLKEWFDNELKDLAMDTFRTMASNHRPYINSTALKETFKEDAPFSRKAWGLMSLEIWYQQFHDQKNYWKNMLKSEI